VRDSPACGYTPPLRAEWLAFCAPCLQYERILGKAALGRGPAEHWAHADYGWLLHQEGDLQVGVPASSGFPWCALHIRMSLSIALYSDRQLLPCCCGTRAVQGARQQLEQALKVATSSGCYVTDSQVGLNLCRIGLRGLLGSKSRCSMRVAAAVEAKAAAGTPCCSWLSTTTGWARCTGR
jgi:hypothetical protein